MYLTYVDESGKPEFENPEEEFVLASLTINEKSWNEINRRIIELKKKYFPDKKEYHIEFHANEIFNHLNCFAGRSLNERMSLFEDIMRLITDIDCTIHVVIIRKDLLETDVDVNTKAIELLYEIIDKFIKRENEKNSLQNKENEYEMVIIDSVNQKNDNKMKLKMKMISDYYNHRYVDKYIIEDPLFVDSKYRNLTQLADCVAYCVRRKFRNNNASEDQKLFDYYFEIIRQKIRTDDDHGGNGLVIFPK